MLVGNFEKNPYEVQDPVSPLRGTSSKQHIISCHISFFRLNTLEGTAKPPAVDILRLNILRDTKTTFDTPTRYDEHPNPCYMGVPPLPEGYIKGTKHTFFGINLREQGISRILKWGVIFCNNVREIKCYFN